MLGMASGSRAGGSDEWVARGTTDGNGVWGVFGGRAAPLAGDMCGWRREVTLSSSLEEGGRQAHKSPWLPPSSEEGDNASRQDGAPAARPVCAVLHADDCRHYLKNDYSFLSPCTTFRQVVVCRTLNCAQTDVQTIHTTHRKRGHLLSYLILCMCQMVRSGQPMGVLILVV
jgi:hypothetical protein